MDELTIPIFRQAYDLYKLLHAVRHRLPKQERHTLWLRAENLLLDVLEALLLASQLPKLEKARPLRLASVKLNMFRFFLRLAKDTRAIDLGLYTKLQVAVDEIGRMLGGWIRSVQEL